MLAVGSSLATSLALLRAVEAGPVQPSTVAARQHVQPALTGTGKVGLSAAAADAVLRVVARPTPDTNPAQSRADRARSMGVPEHRIVWLETFGADGWEIHEPAALDDSAFEARVRQTMEASGSTKLEGFADARANGTMRIHRASDMPELGYRTFQVTLYKDGEPFGGAGFAVSDADEWAALGARGLAAFAGTVDGNDYVVTWPMPNDVAVAPNRNQPA